jgi:hypothetical protein
MSFGVYEAGQSSDVPFAATPFFTRVLKDGTRMMTQPTECFVTWDPHKEKVNPYSRFGPYDPYRIQEMKEAEEYAAAKAAGLAAAPQVDEKKLLEEEKRKAAQYAFEDEMKKRAAAHAAKNAKMQLKGQSKLTFGAGAKKDINETPAQNTELNT